MTYTLPNMLTFFRIALLPVVVLLFLLPFEGLRPFCAFTFAVAGLTDWLDGYLARRLNQSSRFGAFLDPVADKLLVAVALILLVADDPRIWVSIPAMVIVGREILVSALREWMAEVGARSKVAVSMLGKVKTVAQIFAVFFMLYLKPLFGLPVYDLGVGLLQVAAVLTIVSMVSYLRAAMKSELRG